MGAHALPMARAVAPHGRVCAVEPTGWALEKLRKNLSLNPELKPILETVQAVIGDFKAGPPPKSFAASWNLESLDRGDEVHGGQGRDASAAEALALDALADRSGWSRLDLVKMDLDGYELGALKSGRRTLEKFRPVLVLELCPYILRREGATLEELADFLRSLGYSLRSLSGRRRLPWGPDLAREIPEGGSLNALALPGGD